eukprot:SAG31_NODE_4661_length_3058_cov_2.518756_1_plen_198_part_00
MVRRRKEVAAALLGVCCAATAARLTGGSGAAASNGSASCALTASAGRCNGIDDDTAALQTALLQCSAQRAAVEIQMGANCTVGPITLPSHSFLRVVGNLQALPRAAWPLPPNTTHVRDMIVSVSTTNITITGTGCYFLVFVQLFEKYGTLIERNTKLIEKVSPCRHGHDRWPWARVVSWAVVCARGPQQSAKDVVAG